MLSSPRFWMVLALILLLALIVVAGFSAAQYYRLTRSWTAENSLVRIDPYGLLYYTPTPEAPAPPGTRTVVLFGDSRAAEWVAPQMDGYAFFNRGIHSQATAQILGRYEAHVAALQPDIVVVQAGVNDLKILPLVESVAEPAIEHCIANLDEIVARARADGITVILTTIFPAGNAPITRLPVWSDAIPAAIDRVNEHIRAQAGDGVYVLDAYALLATDDDKLRPDLARDFMHLSGSGYTVLNAALEDLLRSIDW
ncbi:MAG: SGNH/GDSL hydrolase family protein [Anaerolineae bacterium]|nr:SGNH/GDSL hydrolase family protein [Anaerolineae bacterium]